MKNICILFIVLPMFGLAQADWRTFTINEQIAVSMPNGDIHKAADNTIQVEDAERGRFTVLTINYNGVGISPDKAKKYSDRERRLFVQRIAENGSITMLSSTNEWVHTQIAVASVNGLTVDKQPASIKVYFLDTMAVVLAHSSSNTTRQTKVANKFFSSISLQTENDDFADVPHQLTLVK